MSKEINECALAPLLYQVNNLYNKYSILCRTNFAADDKEIGSYKKSVNISAMELFRLLDEDFENVFCEIRKLERRLADDENKVQSELK